MGTVLSKMGEAMEDAELVENEIETTPLLEFRKCDLNRWPFWSHSWTLPYGCPRVPDPLWEKMQEKGIVE